MEKRFILFLILTFLVLQVYFYYLKATAPPSPERPPEATPDQVETQTTTTHTPAARTPVPEVESSRPSVKREPAPTVTLRTAVYDLEFTTRGAVPIRWDIIDPRFVYHNNNGDELKEAEAEETIDREELIDPMFEKLSVDHYGMPRPFEIVLKELGRDVYYNELNESIDYVAESITDNNGWQGFRFRSGATESGLRVVKTFLFDPENFAGRLDIELINDGSSRLDFNDKDQTGLGITLGPGLGVPPDGKGALQRFFTIDMILKFEDEYVFHKAKNSESTEFIQRSGLSWGGLQSMYFLTAIIPEASYPFTTARMRIDATLAHILDAKPKESGGDNHKYYPTVQLHGGPISLQPGESRQFGFDLFAGPMKREILKQAGNDLDDAQFRKSAYGSGQSFLWFRALCMGLMVLLQWLHGVLNNWGLSIIMLTIIVRIVTFPFVHKGMKAQAKMTAQQARLKPLIDKINEKFKNDAQRKQQEVFKLYKEHGINPLGMFKGCLWMMVQIPIFIALYRLLYQAIDLRGAEFLWVNDLSAPDRLFVFNFSLPILGNEFNLLPFITAITQMLTSKFTQQPATDPQQQQMQKMMIYFMPVFILFITYNFPSGLMLYWLVSNLWQVVQQIWVNKHIRRPQTAPAAAPADK